VEWLGLGLCAAQASTHLPVTAVHGDAADCILCPCPCFCAWLYACIESPTNGCVHLYCMCVCMCVQGREDVDVFASLPPLASAQGPAGPPKREEFERLLARCQKKDVQSLFKEPVTEVIVSGGWGCCCGCGSC
jgi:hypothetical protein